jgi:hypothetical protein
MSSHSIPRGPGAVRVRGERTASGSHHTGIEHMTLITAAQRQKLLENGRAQRDAIDRQDQVLDFKPTVKLITPDGNATWLLTELNPDIDLAFGPCDLGLGEPELGYVSLAELTAARGPLKLPLECDLYQDDIQRRRRNY